MKTMKLLLILIAFSFSMHTAAYAEDYRFINLNWMGGYNQKNPFNKSGRDTYLEIEFGGKSQRLELYGYVDFLDITQAPDSDNHGGSNIFAEFKPRINLLPNAKIGWINGFYLATPLLIDGKFSLWHTGVGIGTNIKSVGVNLVAINRTEDGERSVAGEWDGYRLDINWYKPIYTFQNSAFISYQGYANYTFAAKKTNKLEGRSSNEFQSYQGLYLNYKHYALGYGLKIYYHMGLYNSPYYYNNNNSKFNSTGFGHYLTLQYKL